MFAEDTFLFVADFAVAATFNGAAIRGIASGGYVEPITNYVSGLATMLECRVEDVPSAGNGDDVVILEGEFAGTYKVREAMPDDSRRFVSLRLERQ